MDFSDSINVTHDFFQDNKTWQVLVVRLNFIVCAFVMKSYR